MSITFTSKFLTELNNPSRQPNIFMEINLGSSTVCWGFHKVLPDVHPVLKSAKALYNKLDIKKNIVTKGNITFKVVNSQYIRDII